jgi:3-phosphoshikimate 1-carboxyvinyltransferase
MGVSSSFDGNTLHLIKGGNVQSHIILNLVKAPDIAQTIAVTCFGLGISCDLTGLHTLKIKETDRLVALDIELSKLGADIRVTNDSLHLAARQNLILEDVAIDTYHDHRMAMAFAPLGIRVPMRVNDADVVSKSYPTFWDDLRSLGFSIN